MNFRLCLLYTSPAETEKPQETEPAPEEQKTESEQKKSSPLQMIMLLLFVIGAAGVGGYLYIKMKGVKPVSYTHLDVYKRQRQPNTPTGLKRKRYGSEAR